MKDLFQKIGRLIDKLSSKPLVYGLEISESSLTYVYFESNAPKTAAVKLATGVIKDGKLADRAAFIEALKALHNEVLPKAADRLLKVDCALPSSAVYTQSFEVPNVGEDKLGETVGLNLQMISPIAVGEANMSAAVIGETPDRYELLGAFAEKAAVDDFRSALIEAKFAPASFEFPSLALARLIARSVSIGPRPVLVIALKSDGLDLLILRDGALHFNYFRSWRSIQGDGRTVSREVFDGVIVDEVRKVINFSVSRWGEGPSGALLVAPNFEAEVTDLLASHFNLRSAVFVPPPPAVPSSFFVALGAAWRASSPRLNEPYRAIDVGGKSAKTMLSQDQMLNFIGVWRNIIAGTLLILLIAFIFAASFLMKMANTIAGQVRDFNVPVDQQTLTDLSAKARSFNELVRGVAAVRTAQVPWYGILNHLMTIARADQVTLTDVAITNFNSPVQVSATAPSYSAVLNFKNALSADPGFTNIDLPLTQVSTQGAGNVGFSVSFNFTAAALSEQ